MNIDIAKRTPQARPIEGSPCRTGPQLASESPSLPAETGPEWQHKDLSHFRNGTGADVFDVQEHFAKWWARAKPGGYDLHDLAIHSAPDVRVSIPRESQERLINLASYNYLGLSRRREVLEAGAAALGRYGLGAAGSPCLSGLLSVHEELASELAAFHGKEAAMLFPSGYSANVGVISTLVGPGDVVVTDTLAHASILDGCVLSKADLRLFRHNDPRSLERKLADAKGRKLVVIEGVYSMDGDIAPLAEIAALCRRYGARLMVDEAHSAFVYGPRGRGLSEHLGVTGDVDIHLGTLSKSLGAMGGYVVGSRGLIEYLRAYARSQVFSCALAPAVVGGVLAALRIAAREPELRQRLWHNVAVMRDALTAEGVDTGESTSQVIPVMVRDDASIASIARELMADGVYLNPIRYPAVKRHQSRFRVSISAAHEPSELKKAAAIIGRVLRRRGISA